MSSRIVTHCGNPHMDDLISVCIVLAMDDDIKRIERRPVEPGEISDSTVWVLDQGGAHDPANRNFDHHHFPADTRKCTLSLIADHFDLTDDLDETVWFRALVLDDTLGPIRAAAEFDCSANLLKGLMRGPINEFVLARFEQVKKLDADNELVKLLAAIGTHLVTNIRNIKERIQLIREKSEFVEINGLNVLFFMEDVPDPKLSIYAYLRETGKKACVVVVKNTRDCGWSLSRVGDHPRVDFRRIKNANDVLFVHANGFVAKTKLIEKPVIVRLLATAIV
ncbi:MAG: MYG1 family protein [Candidatus Anammoxibacter sp.]